MIFKSKQKPFAALISALLATQMGCNNTTLGGGGATAQPAKSQEPVSQMTAQPIPDITPDPQPTAANQAPTSIVPDGVVDGMEVVNDCGRCVQRAQQLSSQIGFQANSNLAANMGFYKINPAQNLCDIHFLSTPNTQIADHEGRDSVLGDQIAIYCPCNCGWPNLGPTF